jgi:gamma-D-glutamyl-L-lysine dipeptidyl-peptidase
MFGICHLSIVPVRSTPSDSSEMVTQLLLGDTFEVLESTGGWELIRMTFDSYEGWIDNKQYLHLTESEFKLIENLPNLVSLDLIQQSVERNGEILLIPFGSTLPNLNNNRFTIGSKSYSFSGKTKQVSEKCDSATLIQTACLLINAPYLWGGRSPLGIDCSGFVQIVFKVNGFNLPRDASQQFVLGETVDFVNEVQAGDLAFFDNNEGTIVHVGILLAPDLIIHASGQVRKDSFDHNGIFNLALGRYSHKLRMIKRLLP